MALLVTITLETAIPDLAVMFKGLSMGLALATMAKVATEAGTGLITVITKLAVKVVALQRNDQAVTTGRWIMQGNRLWLVYTPVHSKTTCTHEPSLTCCTLLSTRLISSGKLPCSKAFVA